LTSRESFFSVCAPNGRRRSDSSGSLSQAGISYPAGPPSAATARSHDPSGWLSQGGTISPITRWSDLGPYLTGTFGPGNRCPGATETVRWSWVKTSRLCNSSAALCVDAVFIPKGESHSPIRLVPVRMSGPIGSGSGRHLCHLDRSAISRFPCPSRRRLQRCLVTVVPRTSTPPSPLNTITQPRRTRSKSSRRDAYHQAEVRCRWTKGNSPLLVGKQMQGRQPQAPVHGTLTGKPADPRLYDGKSVCMTIHAGTALPWRA
jgi:hypothetical protein